jgi:farnesyl-diphosphate farnesyltransferase
MSTSVETPSGKGKDDENFPVGSFLIRPDLRAHVHAFYNFAREADDVADNPDLAPADKVARLARMGAVVQGAAGDDAPSAIKMRASLAATKVTAQHCLDLLRAFTQDATKTRYRDWDDLVDYCRYSAMPVGRHVLDLHGESRATWTANDALCAALQVLNHLQDCVKDHQELDRVYLPEPMLVANGSSIADLEQPRLTPGLRKTIDQLLDRTDDLIETAAGLPPGVLDWRLRAETATIVALARRLSGRLRRGDPVAGRVKLLKVDFASSLGVGLWRSFVGPRPARPVPAQ